MFRQLPRELLQRVALFLPPYDLLNLVETSQSMCPDLDLEIVSSPLTDRASQQKFYQTLCCLKCFAVVVPKPKSKLHSMTFSCRVRANVVKGKVYIVERDVPANQNPENLKRRIAGNEEIKSHVLDSDHKEVSLPFVVKSNKMYQFYVITQGRRGIDFLNMSLDRIGFGHKSTECISYQYDAFEYISLRR
ncbi:MAG: hypothetical protein SGBAC_003965 [Bacillariaceae sp.]